MDCPPACCCQEVALNGSPFQTSCFEGCFFSALLILLLQQSSCIALSSLPGLVALVISVALGPEHYLLSLIFRACAVLVNNLSRIRRLKNSAQSSWVLFLTASLIHMLRSCWKENFPDLPDVLSFTFGHRKLLTPV